MKTINGSLCHAIDMNGGGITAIIGSGGKSTLLRALGLELMREGKRALLTTTTHMYPLAGIPWMPERKRMAGVPWMMRSHVSGCTCAQCTGPRGAIYQCGTLNEQTGKLSAPNQNLNELAQGFDHVLVEADGSHRLPLKAHAAWEPVIPDATARVIWVVGALGLMRPVQEAVHRPEIFCERANVEPCDPATPEAVAQALACEQQLLGLESATVLVNQVDTERELTLAECLEQSLGQEVLVWGR